jgi:site-specific DNA-methyltransferase (adenine-specific)
MLELNKIYNIDCVLGMKQLDSNSIDLVVTSPPYDNLRKYDGFEFDYKKTINELYRVIKDGGVIVWVVGDSTIDGSETGSSFIQALYFKEIGFNLHDTMIYQKINYVPLTHNRYEQSFEYMFVFSKGKPKTFNPIMIPCKNAGKIEMYGLARRGHIDGNQAMRSKEETTYKETKSEKIHPNIFSYSCGSVRTGHPAPFPDDLAKDMIKSWSNKYDLILDPFIGSGTTACQCIETKRNYIGFEISENYCKICEQRIKKTIDKLDGKLLWSV